jgi:2-polyprenyl-3-methyl-5-hydroxy-6-metoxy-1,4-benzoquinol methylase
MEFVSCNLCEIATETQLVETFGNGISLVRCSACGLIFQSPRPTKTELIEYYNGLNQTLNNVDFESAKKLFNTENVSSYTYISSRKSFFKSVFNYLSPLLPEEARVCDLGCGNAMLLDFLREGALAKTSKYKLQGIEPSSIDARVAEEKGYSVFHGVLEDFDCTEGSFDLILMNDVFEHLPDPLATLKIASCLLAPDGRIFIRVPNIPGILLKRSVISAFQFLRKLQSPKGIWAVPDHTYNFNHALLSKYAEKAQLLVEKRGIVPLEIYSKNLRGNIAQIINIFYKLVFFSLGFSLSTNIYVVLRKSFNANSPA